MVAKDLRWRLSFFLLLLGIVAAASAFAGSAVIGAVAGSMNATIGGQELHPNTTIFSGDSIQVENGVAVIAVERSSRMVFGRQTTASFLGDANEVTVLLSRGNVSMYHLPDGPPLRVKVGGLTVTPAKGFKTLGEVALLGDSLVITAKDGSLRVEGTGSALEVAKGKTIAVPVRTARAAGGAPATAVGGATSLLLQATTLGVAGTAATLAGISISRANDAKTNAAAANASAQKADADAQAAAAAASNANTTAVNVGCALNILAEKQGIASPFKPTGTPSVPCG